MTLIESFKTCVTKKYANFSGKASRSEYWWFFLVYVAILLVVPMITFIISDWFLDGYPIYSLMYLWVICALGLVCPFMAVSVRRLHDAGLSGWHLLWKLIPYIGWIVIFFMMIRKSYVDTNKYDHIAASEEKEEFQSNNVVLKSESTSKLTIGLFIKKLLLTIIIVCVSAIGCFSVVYFPFYIILGVYYTYLVWKKTPYQEGDFLMLPLLNKIGLYKDIKDKLQLKKRILLFFSMVIGTVCLSFFAIYLVNSCDDEDVLVVLFIISLIAWIIFFFHEYAAKWLNKE